MKKLSELQIDSKHPLVTRRDFLSHGLISFAGMAALPSFIGMVAQQALADCGGAVVSSMLPFMVFDMAGGAGFPGNFLVGKKSEPEKDMLKSYDLLGWDPRKPKALNIDFGLPMSAEASKILQGILSASTPQARANLRMGSICHFAQDDSANNKLNAAGLVIKAGCRGTYISNGLGLKSSLSGGNSAGVVESSALKPVPVNSVTDALSATNFGGGGFKKVKPSQMKIMAEKSVKLSRSQREIYKGEIGGDMLADLSTCAYEKSLEFVSSIKGLDPRQDTEAQAAYQINANTNPTDGNAVAAALAMNTIRGYGGPSVWTLGDCDYHSGSATKGDGKDLEMGVQIGRAVQLAFRLKRPLFFQLITDGGVSAPKGTRNWNADSGDKCMTILGYYDPKAPPKMIRQQVGAYTDGQGVDRTTLIGADPQLAGYAAFANYLNVCGKLSSFSELVPGVFAPGDLDKLLIFEGKTA